jgi:hypothetical protein
VLAIDVVNLLRYVMSLVLEPAHALLKSFALAPDSPQLRLLLSELGVRVVLRGEWSRAK